MISDKAAQSTYWSDKTINLHVSVLERPVLGTDRKFIPEGTEGDIDKVLEVFFHIQPDKRKTADVIVCHTDDVLKRIMELVPESSKIIVNIITDGPSAQYKNM